MIVLDFKGPAFVKNLSLVFSVSLLSVSWSSRGTELYGFSLNFMKLSKMITSDWLKILVMSSTLEIVRSTVLSDTRFSILVRNVPNESSSRA